MSASEKRFVVAEIDHLVWGQAIAIARGCRHDVVDEGVIPPGRAIAEHRHGTPFEHQSGELVDREVRAAVVVHTP